MATGFFSRRNLSTGGKLENSTAKRRRSSGRAQVVRASAMRAATELLESRCMLSAGSLDSTFGVAGLTTGTVNGPLSISTAKAVQQSDGKIVVGSTVNQDFALARYNANGSIDTTFGNAGYVRTDLASGGSDTLSALALSSDGKIIAAGGSGALVAVVRYNANGSLDTSFNGTGEATYDLSSPSLGNLTVEAVTVDSSHRIVLAGTVQDTGQIDFAAARISAGGALDTSFNGSGEATAQFNTSNIAASSVAVDALGNIVIAGRVDLGSGVVRLQSSGAPDLTFNGTGQSTYGSLQANSVALDSQQGAIVIAGSAIDPITHRDDFAVMRIGNDGSIDHSFNGSGFELVGIGTQNAVATAVAVDSSSNITLGGTALGNTEDDFAAASISSAGGLSGFQTQTVSFGSGQTADANSMAIDASGNITLAGQSLDQSTSFTNIAIARLTAAGAADTSLNGSGTLLAPFIGTQDTFDAKSVLKSDGTILAGFTASQSNLSYLAHYSANGQLDTSFGAAGYLQIGDANFQMSGIAVSSAGNIYVAGTEAGAIQVMAFTAAGSAIAGFGSAGTATVTFAGDQSAAVAIKLDSSGRLVIAGVDSVLNANNNFGVVRLTVAGQLDTTFNGSGEATASFAVSGVDANATSLAIDGSGRIIVAGSANNAAGDENMAVAAFTSAGALDTSFGSAGLQTISFGGAGVSAFGNAVVINSTGHIDIGGNMTDTTGQQSFALAQLTSGGALDPSFNGTGQATLQIGSSTFVVGTDIAVDPGDDITIVGQTDFANSAMAQFTKTGALNSSFGSGGVVTATAGSAFSDWTSIHVDTSNRIVLAGATFVPGAGIEFALSRYTNAATATATNASATSVSSVYGAATATLSASISGSGTVNSGTASFTLTDSGNNIIATASAPVSNGSASVNVSLAGLNVGSYNVNVSYSDSGGNFASSSAAGSLAITPAALTITANNQSRVYGAANPALTVGYAGFAFGQSPTVLSTQATVSTTATPASNVGSYAITASGASATNYTISYVAGSLSVTKAALSVTAANASKSYGAAVPALGGTISGLQNSDNITANYSTAATAASNVGSYAISVTLSDPGSKLGNYTLTVTPATLSVTAANLTIAANHLTKVYGQANPALTGTITGLQNGDNISATYATTATASSGVGSYAISVSVSDPGGKLSNYNLTVTPSTLSVTPATLTITANNATKVYGSGNPALSLSYSGFVNSDTPAVLTSAPTESTTATLVSNVGTYAINVSGAAAANYTFNYVAGTMTVTKAQLYVLVNPTFKWIGQPDPKFKTTDFGFVLGQNATVLGGSLTFTTNLATNSPIGIYLVNASGLSSSNYNINYIPGIAIEL